MFEHFLAELECAILGHIDFRGWSWLKENHHPLQVNYVYPDGHIEKIADNCCANCGHFISWNKDGSSRRRVRSQRFTPDHLKNDPPDDVKARLMRLNR